MPGVVCSSDLYRAWVRLASERFNIAPEPSEELYAAHNAWVKSIVPPDRLLVFRHDMGWAPLRQFLGHEALSEDMDMEFPRTNERGVLRFYKQMAMACGLVSWLLIALVAWSTWTQLRSRNTREGHIDVFKLLLSAVLASLPGLLRSGGDGQSSVERVVVPVKLEGRQAL